MYKVKVKSLRRVRLFATPWTVAYQAPPSMESPGKSTGVGCHFLLQYWCTKTAQNECIQVDYFGHMYTLVKPAQHPSPPKFSLSSPTPPHPLLFCGQNPWPKIYLPNRVGPHIQAPRRPRSWRELAPIQGPQRRRAWQGRGSWRYRGCAPLPLPPPLPPGLSLAQVS